MLRSARGARDGRDRRADPRPLRDLHRRRRAARRGARAARPGARRLPQVPLALERGSPLRGGRAARGDGRAAHRGRRRLGPPAAAGEICDGAGPGEPPRSAAATPTIDLIDDSRGSAAYRRRMIAVEVRRALEAVDRSACDRRVAYTQDVELPGMWHAALRALAASACARARASTRRRCPPERSRCCPRTSRTSAATAASSGPDRARGPARATSATSSRRWRRPTRAAARAAAARDRRRLRRAARRVRPAAAVADGAPLLHPERRRSAERRRLHRPAAARRHERLPPLPARCTATSRPASRTPTWWSRRPSARPAPSTRRWSRMPRGAAGRRRPPRAGHRHPDAVQPARRPRRRVRAWPRSGSAWSRRRWAAPSAPRPSPASRPWPPASRARPAGR